jgi:hypothetical protein
MSSSEPLTTSTPFFLSASADGESMLRVRARILGGLGSARRERKTALPCLPVAPTTRMRLDMLESEELCTGKQAWPPSLLRKKCPSVELACRATTTLR